MNCDEEITAMVEQCGREKETPDVCVMCGIHLSAADIRNHLGLHLLDAALAFLTYLVPAENQRSKTRDVGIRDPADNMTPKIPSSLHDSVLDFNSNPGHSSHSESFHDASFPKVPVAMGTRGGIRAGDYGKTKLPKKAQAPVKLTTAELVAQPTKMLLASNNINTIHADSQTITGATVPLLEEPDHSNPSSDAFFGFTELYPDLPIAVEGEDIEDNQGAVNQNRLPDKEPYGPSTPPDHKAQAVSLQTEAQAMPGRRHSIFIRREHPAPVINYRVCICHLRPRLT